jgi:hypothetical protein
MEEKNEKKEEITEISKEENKKNKEIIEISKEEKEKFLEDLLFKGYTTYEKTILDGKLKIKFKSLSGQQQLEIDRQLSKTKVPAAEFLHNYSILLLTHTLIQYADINLEEKEFEERNKFISSKPALLIDLLTKTNREFHKKLEAILKGDTIEEVFFENPSTSLE